MSSTPSCQAKNVSTSAYSIDAHRRRLADAVTGATLLVQQHRALVLRRARRREQCGHLAGVQRIDAAVALGRGEQHRRVVRAVDDVVVRRVGVQPGELLGDVRVAVLVGPQPGDEELREADHVEQRHARTTPHGPGRVAG